jgi:hypothetical protein
MKTLEQIKKEIAKKQNKIKANENQIMQMDFIDERRAAADNGDFATVKRLRDEAKANNDKIIKLSEEIPLLQIQVAILKENAKAAIVAEYLPKIAEIMKPYEGKRYGEKTREKVREEAHKNGFSFYFDRDNCIVLYPLTNGYRFGSDYDCKITVSDYNTPYITSDNVIQFEKAESRNRYRYTENITKKAKEIVKAFEKMQKAAEAAEALQSEYNSIIPEAMPRMNKVSKYNRIFTASNY